MWFLGEHAPWRSLRHLKASNPNPAVPRTAIPGVAVTWVGHASLLIQMGGKNILTDPVWSNRINGFIRRLQPPGIAWEHLPPTDGVLVSHNHYDHLDWPTLKRLPRSTPCFVPAGLKASFQRRGFTDVTELEWWESSPLGALDIELVPAHHWSRRGLWDLNRSLWGGFVITDRAGRKAYFSGDTAYGPAFKEIGRRHPRIQVAALPVGAYAPRELNRLVHTSPEEALRAFEDLGAIHMLPMHWWTFRLSPEPITEPMQRLNDAWRLSGLPRGRLWDMAIGETRQLDHERQPIPLVPPKKAPRVRKLLPAVASAMPDGALG
jgi:L-ascorbate metabolism protein UlaG (beta-lactamase superfamily)